MGKYLFDVMKWISYEERKPNWDECFFGKIGSELLICTPLGEELHITDSEQWQWIFDKEEEIELRGNKGLFWLDMENDEG